MLLADEPSARSAVGRPPATTSATLPAAERVGFDAVLTPTGTWCEDAWLATAALIPETTTLRFLVAFRPGFVSPTLAAQQAVTFQRLSGGRLLLNVVTGGSAEEQRRFGDFADHDTRYERTAEFLQIVRGAWSGTPFDFAGEHCRVAGATVAHRPRPQPPIFFGGSSDAGKRVAARHADTWLMWGEPPDAAAEQVRHVRALAAEAGREIGFGIRLHLIARRAVGAPCMMGALALGVVVFREASTPSLTTNGQPTPGQPGPQLPRPGHPEVMGSVPRRLRSGVPDSEPIASGCRMRNP